MAHYAYLDENNVVTQVVVGRNEGEGGVDWEEYYGAKRTSYNTVGGVHLHGGTPYRGNYAGIGMIFIPDAGPDGIFVSAQPYPSWVLNPDTALWDAPVLMPTEGGPWMWDESSLSWVEVTEA